MPRLTHLLVSRILILMIASALTMGCGTKAAGPDSPDVGGGGPSDASGGDMGGVEPPNVDLFPEEPGRSLEEAVSFVPGQSLGGTIEAGQGVGHDYHVFSVELEGGTVFAMEFIHVGAGFMVEGRPQARAVFRNYNGLVFRVLDSSQGVRREVFVPQTGRYYIEVDDRRSSDSIAHGGPTSHYGLATASASVPVPHVVAVPTEVYSMMSDELTVYEVVPEQDGVLVAETTALRQPVNSMLDTVLMAWDVEAGELVAYNDDINFMEGNLDSLIAFQARRGRTYWLVLDAFTNLPAGDTNYQLELALEDDHPLAARHIGPGESLTSEIQAATAAGFHTDHYAVKIAPGERFVLEAVAAGDLQPMLDVFDIMGAAVARALPEQGRATVSLTQDADAAAAAYYVVLVDDRRNVVIDEGDVAQMVGGSTFGYTLSVRVDQ